MAKAATSDRAPRGTKILSKAFFSAADEFPAAQRPAVIKAALALISDELKAARTKAATAKKSAKPAAKAKAKAPAKKAAAKKAPVKKSAAKKIVRPAGSKNKPKAVVAKAAPRKVAKKRAAPKEKAVQPIEQIVAADGTMAV
jgi:hypothetical protein